MKATRFWAFDGPASTDMKFFTHLAKVELYGAWSGLDKTVKILLNDPENQAYENPFGHI